VTEEELRALIARGEGQRLEFKAAEADAADLARALVAIANSGGGTLVLGVGDDGGVLGLWYAQPPHIARNVRAMPDLGAWRQFVANLSRHNCEPAVPIAVEHVAVEGRDVLAVHVPDGQDKPYRANGRVYVRVDADVHEATREELARLMVESGRVQYERLPVPGAELPELDDALLQQYFGDVRGLSYPDDADERARLLVNLGVRHAALRACGADDRGTAAVRRAAAGPPGGSDAQVRLLLREQPGPAVARPRRRGGSAAPGHRRRRRVRRPQSPAGAADGGHQAGRRARVPRLQRARGARQRGGPPRLVAEGAKVRLCIFDDRLEISRMRTSRRSSRSHTPLTMARPKSSGVDGTLCVRTAPSRSNQDQVGKRAANVDAESRLHVSGRHDRAQPLRQWL
jgi:hypothetical protein